MSMTIGGEHHGFIKGIGDDDKKGLDGTVGASIAFNGNIFDASTNITPTTEKALENNSIMYGHA